ncbi:MAG: ornithine cyclodeaminase family protein [Nitrospirota bacterium]
MTTEIVVLNDAEVEKLISFDETMRMIEHAFSDYAMGKSRVFPVIREEIPAYQGLFGIKSGYLETSDVLGFKAGGFWSNNKNKGLANHQSVIVLFNPATGQPCAFVAANFVTQIRTAAIGALACKYLARPDCRSLAVIGTGQQGRNQLRATLKVLPSIKKIYLYDINISSATTLARDMASSSQEIRVAESPQQACTDADVIITTTSSYQAIVLDAWIKPGTHINAIGTDTRGKQELDPAIFSRAMVIVDNKKQCLYLGECQHAYTAGIITPESIDELGEIITKRKSRPADQNQITIFDTTGVAIQDLATAGYAFEQTRKKGVGSRIHL